MTYPSVSVDASNRAWRTFLQGLLLDVVVALVLVMSTATSATIEWTRTYWLALASLGAKSAIQAGVSYLARKLVPPKL